MEAGAGGRKLAPQSGHKVVACLDRYQLGRAIICSIGPLNEPPPLASPCVAPLQLLLLLGLPREQKASQWPQQVAC